MKTKNLLLAGALLGPLACFAEASKSVPAKNTVIQHPTDPETWIALLPVIFFALALIITLFKLKKGGVALSDLLAEKDLPVPPPAPFPPPPGAPANPPTPPQSVSRFIAFLTGLVALIIGVCLSTFYMYSYFTNPAKPADLSNLNTVILGLGIGVIPYGANKVASAIK